MKRTRRKRKLKGTYGAANKHTRTPKLFIPKRPVSKTAQQFWKLFGKPIADMIKPDRGYEGLKNSNLEEEDNYVHQTLKVFFNLNHRDCWIAYNKKPFTILCGNCWNFRSPGSTEEKRARKIPAKSILWIRYDNRNLTADIEHDGIVFTVPRAYLETIEPNLKRVRLRRRYLTEPQD